MHPEDKKSVCWLTMLYGVLLLALYLLLTGCGTSRSIAIGERLQYTESANALVLRVCSSLDLASARA
jgi:hypothetical protein